MSNRVNFEIRIAALKLSQCGIAAISVLIVLFYTNHRKKILAERAQLVMLACAYFDEDGNVMVTTEGALPSQMIAKRFALQVQWSIHFWSEYSC